MRSELQIFVNADARRVFDLVAAVEAWPQLLPHYRWVRVLGRDGNRKLVEMAAWRDLIPVWWRAVQEVDPERGQIHFRHVGGITRGMEVRWTIAPEGRGVRVRLEHDFRPGWPLVGGWPTQLMVGVLFVENIAGKTLRRIKALAERG